MLSPDEREIYRPWIKRDLGSILAPLFTYCVTGAKLLNFFESQFAYL